MMTDENATAAMVAAAYDLAGVGTSSAGDTRRRRDKP
jgi:hypothetical protein